MNRILILSLISLLSNAYGQNPEYAWSNAFGSESVYTEANFMAVDRRGNIYTVGAFSGTSDFDHGAGTTTLSNNTQAHYIRKTDSTGNFLWAKMFGGNTTQAIRSIATDSQGNLFLSGSAGAGIDLDPGTANLVLNTPNNNFIIKLNTAGDLVGTRIDSTKFSTSYEHLYIDAGDNLYASGYYMAGYDFDKGSGTFTLVDPPPGEKYVFVTRLDPTGNHLWSEVLSNQPQAFFVTSLCADHHGNAYLSGSFSDPLTTDPGSTDQVLTSAGSYDAFLIRIDSTGAFDWAIQTGGTGDDQGSSVVCDFQGNVILAGGFTGSVDFDPGSNVHTISTPSAGFVQKLTGSGNYVWAKICPSWISSDQTDRKVAVDVLGNVFVSGYIVGTSSFPSSSITVTSQGDRDAIVARYDQNGTVSWAGVIGGEFIDQPYAVSVGPSGMVYVAGAFSSLYADLNPDSTVVPASTGSAITSAFVVALAQPCSNTITLYVPDVADFFCSGERYDLQAQGAGTIEWIWDGVPVDTGGTYETPPLSTGTHTVTVRLRTDYCSGGSGVSETMIADACTGINDLTNYHSIVVAPNPGKGVFQLSPGVQLKRIRVYDAAGNEIGAPIDLQENTHIDLTEQAPGLYLITGTTINGGVFWGRVVKQ